MCLICRPPSFFLLVGWLISCAALVFLSPYNRIFHLVNKKHLPLFNRHQRSIPDEGSVGWRIGIWVARSNLLAGVKHSFGALLPESALTYQCMMEHYNRSLSLLCHFYYMLNITRLYCDPKWHFNPMITPIHVISGWWDL